MPASIERALHTHPSGEGTYHFSFFHIAFFCQGPGLSFGYLSYEGIKQYIYQQT
jgi:hypothetical protein